MKLNFQKEGWILLQPNYCLHIYYVTSKEEEKNAHQEPGVEKWLYRDQFLDGESWKEFLVRTINMEKIKLRNLHIS